MNKLNMNFNGGFPLTLNDFRWIDQGYRSALYGIMSAFGASVQETFILSGCQRTVSIPNGLVTISEGYVSIGGEVCYVPQHKYNIPSGGQVEYWAMEISYEPEGSKLFQNNDINDTYEIRIAKVFVAGAVPPGHSLYDADRDIYSIINSALDTNPSGVIVMWSGAINNIPTGYSLCDGSNGTPDLRGRFIVGYDDRSTNPSNGIWDANYNTVGSTGGNKEIELNDEQIPFHKHGIWYSTTDSGVSTDNPAIIDSTSTISSGNQVPGSTYDYGTTDVQSDHGVDVDKVDIRPPYFTLAYIMKL